MRSGFSFFGSLMLLGCCCVGLNEAEDQLPDDNALLEDYATNAALTTEERKIIALLKGIENKFSTLGDDEKVEFVKKIASYQDRFATTLAKVETIPGNYGLNVPFLRTNLDVPSIAAEEAIGELEMYEFFIVADDKMSNEQTQEVSVDQSEVLAMKAAASPREPRNLRCSWSESACVASCFGNGYCDEHGTCICTDSEGNRRHKCTDSKLLGCTPAIMPILGVCLTILPDPTDFLGPLSTLISGTACGTGLTILNKTCAPCIHRACISDRSQFPEKWCDRLLGFLNSDHRLF